MADILEEGNQQKVEGEKPTTENDHNEIKDQEDANDIKVRYLGLSHRTYKWSFQF